MNKSFRLSSLVLMLALSGCGQKSTEELIQSAAQYQADKNLNAAVIELKSAIQQEPAHQQARVMLGRIYLQLGNPLPAEKELLRALENGVPFKDLALDLAATAYLSGKKVDPKLFSPNDISWLDLKPLVDSFEALHLLDTGEIEQLSQHLTAMAALSEPADAVSLRNALTALLSKDLVQTGSLLKEVTITSVLYRDVQLLLAKTELSQGLFKEAITTLQNYLQLTPFSNLARLMLAEAYLRTEQFPQAATTLEPILKQFPEQPLANYIMAVVNYQKSDFVQSKEQAEKALNNGFTAPNVRVLAALAAINQGLDAQALAHLRAIKTFLPNMPPLQKLYAMLELREGNTEYARDILTSSTVSNEDIKMMSGATYQMLRQGDVDSARKLIAHIEKNVDKNVENLATLGMLKMNLGDFKQDGIENLKQVLALDPKANESRLALALGLINSQKYDEAAAVAAEWVKDPLTATLGYTVQAYSAFFQKDFKKAKEICQLSLAAEPNNIQLMLLMTRMAMAEKDRPAANEWLSKALAVNPNFEATLELNYSVQRGQATAKDAAALIKAAESSNPDNKDLKLLHAAVLIDQKDYKAALELINKIDTKTGGAPSKYWLLKSIAEQSSGNMPAAIATVEEWLKNNPQSSEAKLSLARVYAANRNFGKALQLVQELSAQFPENDQLKGMQLLLLAETGDTKGANALISTLPDDAQSSAGMLFLQGKLLIADKKFTEAIQALEKSYQKNPNAETAILLSDLYSRNETAAKAVSFIENHFSTHPGDANLKAMYANLLINIEPVKAISNFKALLAEDEDNILALNNLAYVYTGQNKLDEAQTYAAKALKLMPNHPAILDTYGKVMFAKGDLNEAIKHFEASLKLRKDHPEVQLNYAEALLKNKQSGQAKAVVTAVTTTDPELMKRKAALIAQL